jgi:hypothetical protein
MVYETGEIDLWCCFVEVQGQVTSEDRLAYLYTIYETVADPSSLLDILTKESKGLHSHLYYPALCVSLSTALVEKPSEGNR